MNRIKILLTSSTFGLALALTATPAAAQEACVTNPGAVTSGSALGPDTLACGNGSVASMGLGGLGRSTAIGVNAEAIADLTTAIGYGAVASEFGATALGVGSTAADGSVALGAGATVAVGFTNSVAIGYNTVATASNQVALGGQTAATARTVTGVAPGTLSATSFDAVNGSQLFTTNANVAALDTRLDTLEVDFENEVVRLDERIDRFDRRASGGTAVAIALGGNAFLPDKQFNLTANIGTYRGAHAAAIQIGALISPNAAFNAGVATGFNRGGKLGARAGVTFGW